MFVGFPIKISGPTTVFDLFSAKESRCMLLLSGGWKVTLSARPLTAQNFLNFMQFLVKFGKIVCWRPLEDWRPSYGQSWIRPRKSSCCVLTLYLFLSLRALEDDRKLKGSRFLFLKQVAAVPGDSFHNVPCVFYDSTCGCKRTCVVL